ncbi:unnamed protein product [Protopolystoma xenopodis]|uniref:Uncharacterized protein n=1 Tax=Protopolystoma xenopodis TaxID=117903 RepID=A0A448WDX5_9PLAT|nr:unnamed protein product [Protopolystoma xenopodis]
MAGVHPLSMCACVPADHGTRMMLGLVRGLVYWRLTARNRPPRTITAVDQFGAVVATSNGLGIEDDDIALLV